MHRPRTRPFAHRNYLSAPDAGDSKIHSEPRQDEWKRPPFSGRLRLDPQHGAGKDHRRHARHLPPTWAKDTRGSRLIRKLGVAETRQTHYGQGKESSERSHVIPFLEGMDREWSWSGIRIARLGSGGCE